MQSNKQGKWKRPEPWKKGTNTNGRHSCLGGQNKKWKEHLEGGRSSASVDYKQLERDKLELDRKMQFKRDAVQTQIDYGMSVAEPMEEEKITTKSFLQYLFPEREITYNSSNCVMYRDTLVFRKKEDMQVYFKRSVTEDEWQANKQVLSEMKMLYIAQRQREKLQVAPVGEVEGRGEEGLGERDDSIELGTSDESDEHD